MQRTHRTLRDALIQLVLERGWDAVSVQDVCTRADVGRSTFYTHFADKEDLLADGLGALRGFLRAQQRGEPGDRPLAFARGMIEHAHEQRRLFRAVIGKRSGQVVQRRFRQLLIDLVREDLAGVIPAGPRLEATVHYFAGAFFDLLIWWLDARSPLRPADVAALFHELATPALAAVQRSASPNSG